MTSRRDVLKKLLQGGAAMSTGGLAYVASAGGLGNHELALRPPGALPEKGFIASCVKCGQCVEACPYDTLVLAEPGTGMVNGTPHFIPRNIPCYMCPAYPCTVACPSGALDVDLLMNEEEQIHINEAKMGLAVVHKETCVAFWGIQCDACYRACPLIGEAISIEYVENKVTNRHANLQPVINSDSCTGCGICEKVCIVEKPAIKVFPRSSATGEIGDHYIRSWVEGDEQRMNLKDKVIDADANLESAMDYLNDDELIDDNE